MVRKIRFYSILPLIIFSIFLSAKADEALIKQNDTLAICGDSITYANQYSAFINSYLTACMPQLEVKCVKNAVSGETTGRFLLRQEKTCINFYHPTVATICYGMNDGRYGKHSEEAVVEYRRNLTEAVKKFKEAGVRVILGSPGIVGRPQLATTPEYNNALKKLRDVAEEIAKQEKVPFADIHNTMLEALRKMREREGDKFDFCCKDGIHPAQPGQFAMFIAYLNVFGLDGKIAEISLDLPAGKATSTPGQKLISTEKNGAVFEGTRYPFCFYDHIEVLANMRKVAEEMDFFNKHNRFILKAKLPEKGMYKVYWEMWNEKVKRWSGANWSKDKAFSSEELEKGINLAKEFIDNPFRAHFQNITSRIVLQYVLQYSIQSGMMAYKNITVEGNLIQKKKFIEDKLLKPTNSKLTVEVLAKDPHKLVELLDKFVKDGLVPVKYRIRIEKEGTK